MDEVRLKKVLTDIFRILDELARKIADEVEEAKPRVKVEIYWAGSGPKVIEGVREIKEDSGKIYIKTDDRQYIIRKDLVTSLVVHADPRTASYVISKS